MIIRSMLAIVALCAVSFAAQSAVVLHQGNAIELSATLADINDLWVTSDDLTRINGFVLKPEGLCRDEICVPLRQNADSDMYVSRQGKKWINLTGFADKMQQAHVRDVDADVWSFGEMSVARDSFLQSARAPDFELQDRKGRTVRLSDYRGKKVMLVTWASWCGCRLDVAAWQPIYEELKHKNFELISVAQDTAGEAAAGPIIDAAHVTYTTLIDTKHRISSLYNFVNVPSAAWIDEEGRVVRINEGTYAKTHRIGATTIGTDEYTPALRDWVEKGAASKFVWSSEQVADKIRRKTSDEAKAEALFALGAYFHEQKNTTKADAYWSEAAALFPDSWNMHRQDWAITDPANTGRNFRQKRESLTKPYYRDLELH